MIRTSCNGVARQTFRLVRSAVLMGSTVGAVIAAPLGGPAQLEVTSRLDRPWLAGIRYLPGDAEPSAAIGTQMEVAIAEGGPGFLAVWTDERTVIAANPTMGHLPLGGNQQDIYARVFDHFGQPLGPLALVTNQGRNQRDPMAAWNGSGWLVVFETERPDWYFDQNVSGVRVSPTGEVLDAEPLVIFSEQDGQGVYDPHVTSDGLNWLVVADQWIGSNRVVRARRIAPGGSFIDPQPVNLQVSNSLMNPVADFAGGVYLLAANNYADGNVHFRLFGPDLVPVSGLQLAGPAIGTQRTAIASNGDRFLVVGRRAHRIEPDGTLLDPTGIELGGSESSSFQDACWTGTHWVVSMRTFGEFAYYDVAAQRIGNDGSVLDVEPVLVESAPSGLDNFKAPTAVGGVGNGDATVVFVRGDDQTNMVDVRSARLDAGGFVSPPEDVSIGLTRQTFARTATGDGEHLAVFVSERSGRTRILSQRIAFDGSPIDSEPTVVHTVLQEGPTPLFQPEVAWDGSVYCVVWSDAGSIVGKRLSPLNTVIDPDPLSLILDRPGPEGYGVGAITTAGDVFVVGAFHYVPFSEPDRWVEYVRIRGSDGVVLDAQPVMVAGGFAREMAAAMIGDRALLVWAQYALHDSATAYIQGVVVSADGTQTGSFPISSSNAKEPDAASEGGRALVVWHEKGGDNDIRGRFVLPDGGLDGAPFTISAAANHQMLPAVGFDGRRYVVAWTDFRTNSGVEQLRGDIRAARVDSRGNVLDPDGFAVTTGPLPEDLPAVAAAQEKAVILFSKLNGEDAVPEVQRLGYRVLSGRMPWHWR